MVLNRSSFQIGLTAVVLLVLLRVTIGWHFLYEGVWKIANSDTFSAEPFLTQAKGPFAPLFYSMIPDIDGRERLQVVKDKAGGQTIQAPAYTRAWDKALDRFAAYYRLDDKQRKQAERICDQYKKNLDAYLAEHRQDILGYFDSLDRFVREERGSRNQGAHFQRERLWERQQALRAEVNGWLRAMDAMGDHYWKALYEEVLTPAQRGRGRLKVALVETQYLPVPVPFVATRSDLLNKTVTYALTLIGLGLMAGCLTRLAALGGAGFLAFVVMTQWPWPTVVPKTPEIVGHALLVDKNFVEMMALLALAALPVGRWAGLDYFLYHGVCLPMRNMCGCCCKPVSKTTAGDAAAA
ncbi:MAG: hypothetical protein ACUVTW_00845 [Thermogutta sp.]